MIVVCNTSPLTNLAAIGQFELLHQLYGEVHIADGVWAELNAYGGDWPGRKETANAHWIWRRTVGDQVRVAVLLRDLDRGEAESIALALEIGADLILMDEQDGRHMAQRLGLRVTGVVGMLLEAKGKGRIDQLRPYLDALRWTANFYLSDAVYRAVLTLAGEA